MDTTQQKLGSKGVGGLGLTPAQFEQQIEALRETNPQEYQKWAFAIDKISEKMKGNLSNDRRMGSSVTR